MRMWFEAWVVGWAAICCFCGGVVSVYGVTMWGVTVAYGVMLGFWGRRGLE